jgi:hypothetical protein
VVVTVDGLWLGSAFEPARFPAARRRLLLRRQIDALMRAMMKAIPVTDQLRHTLKTPYRDGTTHIVLEPLDLMTSRASR